MMKRIFLFLISAVMLFACSDDEQFSLSMSDRLTFSVDTVSIDTVFSAVPSQRHDFWVYNHSGKSLRIESVRLKKGNQTGFRVNVDGFYLDNSRGSQVADIELAGKDSLRVFVELTTLETNAADPVKIEDELVFQLQSGLSQEVKLLAYSWDAEKVDFLEITRDTTIASTKPIVIYKGIKIDSLARLTVANTTLYFYDQAGIDVYGSLMLSNSTLRGDRLDNMFDYLPYDRVSGQWRGLHFYPSSTGNVITCSEIRNAENGIECDSTAFDSQQVRLFLDRTVLHNCKGNGLRAFNSFVVMQNCQITNTLGDCLAIYGGLAQVVYCTIAQYYPYSADRGVALRFANSYEGNSYPLYAFSCINTLVTGYADDEVMGEMGDTLSTFDYQFANCLLRTPEVEDSIRFKDIVWEQPSDSVQGKQHFASIDEENLFYCFKLDSVSTARNRALPLADYSIDLIGRQRKATPDIGCYERDD